MVDVLMTVKETSHPKNPNPLYSIQTLEVGEPAREAPTEAGIERDTEQGRPSPQAGSGVNIVPDASWSNESSEISGGADARR